MDSKSQKEKNMGSNRSNPSATKKQNGIPMKKIIQTKTTKKLVKIPSKKENEEKVNSRLVELTKRTHFTEEQIQALIKIFGRLTSSGRMDRLRFRDFAHSTFDITEELILDRMFSVISEDQGSINETQFLIGMSIITRGSIEEKITFAFRIYDITNDNQISREEVEHFMKNTMNSAGSYLGMDEDDVSDSVKEIGEIVFRKLDLDHNGIITPDEFHEACVLDPLLIECLGHCIPSSRNIHTFLALFADDVDNYDCGLSPPGDPTFEHQRYTNYKNSSQFKRNDSATKPHQHHFRTSSLIHESVKYRLIPRGTSSSLNQTYKIKPKDLTSSKIPRKS